MLVQIAVTGPLVFGAAFLTKDLVSVAASITFGEVIVAGVRLWCIKRFEGIGVVRTLGAALRPILASLVMYAAVLAVSQGVSGLGAGVQLALCVLVGAVIYGVTILLIDRQNTLRSIRPLRKPLG